MTPRWTRDEVAAMAPDPASAKAGAGLSAPSKWVVAGGDADVIWGECQGSGKDPYRAAVDLGDAASKCSCPSRKFPCKHALGLMMLHAAGGAAGGARPEWVEQWQQGRMAARRRKEESADKPVDAVAQEKRRAKRQAAMADGVAESRLWLLDAVRGGLDALRRRPAAHFAQTAARMVDAQAPGLGAAILRLSLATTGDGWEAATLREAALLHLLLRRAETAPDDRAGAALLGAPTPREDVLASGPGETGEWVVLGHHTQTEALGPRGEMLVRRVWLARRGDGRNALLLSHAHPKQPQALDTGWCTGESFEGELAYYPDGLRALVRRRGGEAPADPPLVPGLAAADALRRARRAADLWSERSACVVDGVALRRDRTGWQLADAAGLAVPVVNLAGGPWLLLALTGGHPARLSVEWDGAAVRPLAVWTPDGAHPLNGAGGLV